MIRTATGDRVRARIGREELTRGEIRPTAEQGPVPPHLLPPGATPKPARGEERIQAREDQIPALALKESVTPKASAGDAVTP